MKKERYLREMDDQNDNAFSLIADFDGNEDQVFDIKVGETLPVKWRKRTSRHLRTCTRSEP